MKESTLCHICACLRSDFEAEGYTLYSRDIRRGERYYYYHHVRNGNTISIVLNLNFLWLRVFKNGKLIKVVGESVR